MFENVNIDEIPEEQKGYISQVYVVHESGLVALSRRYKTSCVSSNPQLIGGFIAALLNFIKSASEHSYCDYDARGEHKLTDIGTTCSRWFLKTINDFTIAVLVHNDSPVLKSESSYIINRMTDQIYDIFKMFKDRVITKNRKIDAFIDFTDEIGGFVDNIIYESILEFTTNPVSYTIGENVIFNSNYVQTW